MGFWMKKLGIDVPQFSLRLHPGHWLLRRGSAPWTLGVPAEPSRGPWCRGPKKTPGDWGGERATSAEEYRDSCAGFSWVQPKSCNMIYMMWMMYPQSSSIIIPCCRSVHCKPSFWGVAMGSHILPDSSKGLCNMINTKKIRRSYPRWDEVKGLLQESFAIDVSRDVMSFNIWF